MSELVVDLKAVLNLTEAQAKLDRFRADEDHKGITENVKLDTRKVSEQLLKTRAEIDKTIGKVTGKVDLDSRKALSDALALRLGVDRELKKTGVIDVDVRTDKALLQLAKFDVEAKAITDRVGKIDAGGGGSGLFSSLTESLSGLSKFAIPALVVGLTAALPLIAGVTAGLTAAGAGAGAFALLGYPAIQKVIGALGDTKKQLEKLPAGERGAVDGINGLKSAWDKASASFSPDVFKLISGAVGTMGVLLKDAVPFAKTFAGFLGEVERDLSHAVVSPQFTAFLDKLHGYEGPALHAIAAGFGHITENVGKLLTVMSGKDVVNALNITFSILDGTVIALTKTIEGLMIGWDKTSAAIATASEHIYHDAIQPMTNWFEVSLPHAWSVAYTTFMANFVSPIHSAYSNVISGTQNDFVDKIVNFFTGTIPHAWSTAYNAFQNDFVHPLENAFRAVVSTIAGIWSGLKSAITTPINFVLGIVNKVDGFLDHIPGVSLPTGLHLARGGAVPGGIHGRDSVPAMLAPGELVIPSSHAASFGDMARRASIPGFAAGGTPAPLAPGRAGALGAQVTSGGNGALAGLGHDIAGIAGDIGSLLTSGAKAAVSGLLGSLVNDIPGSGLAKDIVSGMAKAAISGITGAMSSAAASGGPGGTTFNGKIAGGGFESLANLAMFARYFMANGLNAAAAAGIAATISGEETSAGPESRGSGGWGLIGWTGNTVGLPAGYTGPTGNVAYDLQQQLKGVIGYMNSRGGRGPLNAAGNPVAAGDVWSRYEAPLVPLSDTRPGVANAIYAMLMGGSAAAANAGANTISAHTSKPHSGGGVINEPVYGVGLNSGIGYSFAENGQPEYVANSSQAGAGNAGMPGATNIGQQQMINQNNTMIKLLQQLAQLTKANAGGAAAGFRTGYYSTGG